MTGLAGRAATSIAATQRTLITREQLIACGVGRNAISHRLSEGRLRVVFRAVYTMACGELPPLAREQAALLACGDGAFLSHHTAAALWGLRQPQPAQIDVSVPGRSCGSRDGLRVHRVSELHARDVRRLEGLPISSPARALLELAPELTTRELERALDEVVIRKLATPNAVKAVLARYPARRGCARLTALIDDPRGTTMTRSEAEERFLALVRKAQLPAPVANVRIGRHEVDFVWPSERVIVEIDGYRFHSGRRAFESDHARDAELIAAGWTVLRFTWRAVVDKPETVLVRVAQALTRAAAARNAQPG